MVFRNICLSVLFLFSSAFASSDHYWIITDSKGSRSISVKGSHYIFESNIYDEITAVYKDKFGDPMGAEEARALLTTLYPEEKG